MPSYTYNGVTATATRRRPSSRTDKKYMRTVTVGDRTRLVHYGDPNLEMKRDDPERRRNFLARHNCSGKRDPFAPGFWACLDWQRTNEKETTMPDTIAPDTRTHDAIVEKGNDWMKKDEDGEGEGEDGGEMKYPYFGVTSFAELEDIQASEMAAEKVHELGEMFQSIAGNIMRDMEVTDKAGALRGLVDEFQTRLDTLNGTDMATSSTGVAFAAAKAWFFIIHSPRGGSSTYAYIYNVTDGSGGGTSLARNTGSTALSMYTGVITRTTVARNMRFQSMYARVGGQI